VAPLPGYQIWGGRSAARGWVIEHFSYFNKFLSRLWISECMDRERERERERSIAVSSTFGVFISNREVLDFLISFEVTESKFMSPRGAPKPARERPLLSPSPFPENRDQEEPSKSSLRGVLLQNGVAGHKLRDGRRGANQRPAPPGLW